jgi:hypothetical protein
MTGATRLSVSRETIVAVLFRCQLRKQAMCRNQHLIPDKNRFPQPARIVQEFPFGRLPDAAQKKNRL